MPRRRRDGDFKAGDWRVLTMVVGRPPVVARRLAAALQELLSPEI